MITLRCSLLLSVATFSLASGEERPKNATVLFDGSGFAQWQPLAGSEVKWTQTDGVVTIVPGTGSILTRARYRDFRLHVEFNVPPASAGAAHQERSNSGVYLQRRYEVQILDSFGLESGSGDCGALYRQRAPDRNACKPPGEWQTYDIVFHAARFETRDGASVKVANARISVRQNGVLIHDDVELQAKTGAGEAEGPEPGPILLQDHGAAVRFRNVWIVALDEGEGGKR
ncbi:MAG: DUF1080 domain-containing protein [Planctomycetota bacterium]